MSKLERAYEFTCTISPDGAVIIQAQDGSNGYGWGPHTNTTIEIVECLETIGLIPEAN